jgi:hypothetical protein
MAKVMSERTRRRQLAELWALKERAQEMGDEVTVRIAYEMHTAVRRVTEPMVGWPSLAKLAEGAADLLKAQMRRPQP